MLSRVRWFDDDGRLLHLLLLLLGMMAADALELGYYAVTCPDAEEIVRHTMERQHYNDPSLAPAIIRMLFHDCFVRGCDASVMIVPTRTRPSSERVAIPNHTLRGFNAVDVVKRALEAACPRTVSCADALALMARDAVTLLGGRRYDVPLGRRDGTQSNPWEVDLPAPFAMIDDVLRTFSGKGFSAEEMVLLLGAHTVGGAHCASFRYRLLTNDNKQHGTLEMEESFRYDLLQTCGAADQPLDTDSVPFIDPETPFAIDN
ncbi:hypothetical protein PR202_ga07887 [Eleusine coracana subsp. coracana]|uniref:peroxidase n=1 Tax=Eleusine coracana subsp. coracana TaxID=191504 RepID=A0AAV5BZU0_ELECO|nr:hypothetical protein PR202_ga07887 [Eleusine coracana subsp. coracana]